MEGEIKVFQMNDCDWMAARSLEEAVDDYKKNYVGDDEHLIDDPCELSDEAMNRLLYTRTEDDGDPVGKVSFRQQLNLMIAEGQEFPCFFASTEY